jgi:DNA-directed RNA polymerase specialized sigma24 family protein
MRKKILLAVLIFRLKSHVEYRATAAGPGHAMNHGEGGRSSGKGGCRSHAEVQLEIARLSQADLLRLRQIARGLVRAKPIQVEPDELLNEALAKALEGERKIPRDVPVVVALANAMKSIVSNELKSHNVKKVDRGDLDALAEVAQPGPSLEDNVIAQDLRAKLIGLFEDDDTAALLIEGHYLEGMTAAELKTLAGLSDTAYESKMKAIRRRIGDAVRRGVLA